MYTGQADEVQDYIIIYDVFQNLAQVIDSYCWCQPNLQFLLR